MGKDVGEIVGIGVVGVGFIDDCELVFFKCDVVIEFSLLDLIFEMFEVSKVNGIVYIIGIIGFVVV